MQVNLLLFIKGIAVGFAIAAPVGPVGILCIQRSLTKGALYGLVSGMGAAVADATFGAIATFGVSFVADFLARQQYWFQLAGSLLLLAMGIHAVVAKRPPESARVGAEDLAHDWATTFLLTITNPITIFSLTAVFVAVGISTGTETLVGGALVTGVVFLGSALWWTTLCGSVSFFHGQLPDAYLRWIRKASGGIMLFFGTGVMVHLWT